MTDYNARLDAPLGYASKKNQESKVLVAVRIFRTKICEKCWYHAKFKRWVASEECNTHMSVKIEITKF